MTPSAVLRSALWRWGVPALVLLVGLSGALANTVGPRRGLEIAVSVGLALPLVYRTQAPVRVFGIVMAVAAVQATLGSSSQVAVPLAIIVASEAVGRHAEEPVSWIAPLALITISFGLVVFGDDDAGDLLFGGTVMVGVWFLGRSLRLRAQAVSTERERTALLVGRAEARELEAIEAERARMARELHDIVGHATSLITIRLQALRRSLDSNDPVAGEIKSIEEDARQALSEMRRLVSLVRTADGEAALEPQPGLRDLPRLVDSMQKAGFRVDTHVAGLPESLNPGVDLAAYRLIQEALTNALRHSGGTHVEVSISADTDTLEIDVKDDGAVDANAAPGRGLIGMRERALLYGGTVSAGPVPEGGYRVRAALELGEGPL